MNAVRKRFVVCLFILFLGQLATAQSTLPAMGAYAMEGYNHEDLSDILRLFPGMYPQDLGTLWAPLYFLPWGLWPGQMRYTLDGLPLERRYDGLWDPGLLPVSEIDSIAFRALPIGGLFPGAAGRIDLMTRDLPVDSPYSEIRLREGYYEYGTVDFAHGQGIYKTLTFQLTGQLGWYGGLRDRTASRLTRVRAKLSFRPARNWRLDGLCYRAKLRSDSELNAHGETFVRSEAQLALAPTDSIVSRLRPSLRLFLREDTERWGDPWEARDRTGGVLLSVSLRLPGQRLQATGLARFSSLHLPPQKRVIARDAELSLADSLDIAGLLGIELGAGVHFDTDWDAPAQRFGARGYLPVARAWTAFGGFQRLEQYPAPLWREGGYSLVQRPLLITAPLASLDDSLIGCPTQKERISQAEAGLSADLERMKVYISAIKIVTDNQFSPWTSRFSPHPSSDSRWGGALETQLTLPKDLLFQTRWSLLWTSESDLEAADEMRGFSRLYLDRTFFKAPLHIRASLSHTYLGARTTFGYLGLRTYDPVHLVGFRISARIGGFMLIWGTENVTAKHYEYIPGFLMIRKQEYWGFKWMFWH